MANCFKVKRILVLLHFGGASGRDLLSGILDAITPKMHWHTRIMSGIGVGDAYRMLSGIDGIITSERGNDAFRAALERANVPTVVIGQSEADFSGIAAPMAFVHNDDIAIGHKACHYFQSLGDFRSFIFLPASKGTRWSEQRETGFRDALADAGRDCRSPRLTDIEECDEDNKRIQEIVCAAEKPCAIFAAWDGRAAQALTICAESGIAVPEQAVVLGTDDDELICGHANPPLSSIKPDHHKVGSMAVAELRRLFKSPPKTRRIILCPSKAIVERESTRPIPPLSQLVRRALTIIREQAAHGLTPSAVADRLGVSRRLLDLRLRQTENATIHELIVRARLNAVARELRKSRLTIRSIARNLGFGDIKWLERQFKARFGQSMTAYRAARRHDGHRVV